MTIGNENIKHSNGYFLVLKYIQIYPLNQQTKQFQCSKSIQMNEHRKLRTVSLFTEGANDIGLSKRFSIWKLAIKCCRN